MEALSRPRVLRQRQRRVRSRHRRYHFKRKLADEPLLIGWNEITSARLGKWHAGQWGSRHPVLKVAFDRDDLSLSAGFTLSRDWPEMEQLAADINTRASRYPSTFLASRRAK